MSDPAGSLTFSYDERGNVLTNNRVSGGTKINTTYTYDKASRVVSIAYPSGMKVAYTCDDAGNIKKTTVQASKSTNFQTVATSSYKPFGPVLR